MPMKEFYLQRYKMPFPPLITVPRAPRSQIISVAIFGPPSVRVVGPHNLLAADVDACAVGNVEIERPAVHIVLAD